jgi:hypothetical protein
LPLLKSTRATPAFCSTAFRLPLKILRSTTYPTFSPSRISSPPTMARISPLKNAFVSPPTIAIHVASQTHAKTANLLTRKKTKGKTKNRKNAKSVGPLD